MKLLVKVVRLQFIIKLIQVLLALVAIAGSTIACVAVGIGLLIEAFRSSTSRDDERLYLAGAVVVFVFALLTVLVLRLIVRNAAVYPSGLCKGVAVTEKEIELLILLRRSIKVTRDQIRCVATERGAWLEWNEAGRERRLLVDRNVFGPQKFEELEDALRKSKQ